MALSLTEMKRQRAAFEMIEPFFVADRNIGNSKQQKQLQVTGDEHEKRLGIRCDRNAVTPHPGTGADRHIHIQSWVGSHGTNKQIDCGKEYRCGPWSLCRRFRVGRSSHDFDEGRLYGHDRSESAHLAGRRCSSYE